MLLALLGAPLKPQESPQESQLLLANGQASWSRIPYLRQLPEGQAWKLGRNRGSRKEAGVKGSRNSAEGREWRKGTYFAAAPLSVLLAELGRVESCRERATGDSPEVSLGA